jgi:hypothetical protein
VKKLIAWPLAHLCFCMGELFDGLVSRPQHWLFDRIAPLSARAYSACMGWSVRLNDWAGLKIWMSAEEVEDPEDPYRQ